MKDVLGKSCSGPLVSVTFGFGGVLATDRFDFDGVDCKGEKACEKASILEAIKDTEAARSFERVSFSSLTLRR